MNTLPYQNTSYDPHKFPIHRVHVDSLAHLLSSAHSALAQPPPPSLREILSAYRTKGDGDRDMLLALLNAKTAEDQRLSSVASLHRSMLDIYQSSPPPEPRNSIPSSGTYHHPPPVHYNQCPSIEIYRPPSQRYHRRRSSRSRSPPAAEVRRVVQETTLKHSSERPSKRHRLSRSPHSNQHPAYESSHPSEHYPLSPYSTSERSDSAEYSPRSRSSMTIGSLLSTRPTRDMQRLSPEREAEKAEPS